MATAPALRGTLDELPLPELLALLARAGSTGELHVGGRHGGSLWLEDGTVYAAGMHAGQTLWDSFVRSGAVTADGWQRATAAVVATGGSLADALVLQGGADAGVVRRVLHERVVATMFELVLQAGAPFEFRSGERHPSGRYPGFGVDELVVAVRRRVATWREIAATIPSTGVVPRIRAGLPDGVAQVTLAAREWHVLSGIDGRRTVAEVVRHLGLSAFDVCSVLHRLVVGGAVEVLEPEPGQSS